MIKEILAQLFGKPAVQETAAPKPAPIDDDPIVKDWHVREDSNWPPTLRKVDEFPTFERLTMDGAGSAAPPSGGEPVATAILQWFGAQSFIGHQACAILAQHWLIDKACTMSAQDAVRNGYKVSLKDGGEITPERLSEIAEADNALEINKHLIQFGRFTNIFGIRVCIFEIESSDPDYYEKPFNPDGITTGSYKGISQVDPYWMTPVMDNESTSDPAGQHFYEPAYWLINGVRYHRSHLIIGRTEEVADILKPSYMFGGIPLTQKIYERVYAAERTANEAPLLAMTKRLNTLNVDMSKVAANQAKFESRLQTFINYRDNHGVWALDNGETMQQFDTTLTEVDNLIWGQYELVASIAGVPATKLLGTQMKGFGTEGGMELRNYNQFLETLQTSRFTPFLQRHLLCLCRSKGWDYDLQLSWNPVDSHSAEEQANINKAKAETAQIYITNGVISPEEERDRLRQDREGGYPSLVDDVASEELTQTAGGVENGEEAVQGI